MTYLIYARKYRPQTFEEMIGQKPIVRTLQNAIKNNRVAQAYIFSGMRGVGKTTAARILAKALNCQQGPTPTPCNKCEFCKEINEDHSIDVLEIDGASNRGIDDVRSLREGVKYKPIRSRYKVIIIDEVHMLTREAFNALLKTLEEPPPHTVFIFATTEFHKVPATIVSRCQHFEFKKISQKEIIKHLIDITQKEKIEVSSYGLNL
ncbi:MAG: DNA polymerase III subunit gamma/tau, partial [Candidatus Aminicenantes bacterium]|nr:DNA polymerase III subunit gamma/tau [Candidatus Aminicenantes bacterium]